MSGWRAVTGGTVSIILPTFNERDNLPVLLERIERALSSRHERWEVVVVDDDSPDRTWEAAEQLRRRYPFLRVVRRTTGVKGLSPSVVEGWQVATGEVLVVMDADLQHPPEVLPALLKACESPDVDIVVASRYRPEGAVGRWVFWRRWMSRGASHLAQAVLPPAAHAVTDPMSGFFSLRRRVVEGLALQPRGYKILLEVLGRGRYRVVREVAYVFGRRQAGQSKLTSRVMVDYLRQLVSFVWEPEGFGRFVRYCLVGGSGVAVNMGILWWLKSSGALGTLRAGTVAIEASILNNFLWNELWTFRDRSREHPGLRDRLVRLAQFHLVCGVGAVWQLGLLWGLAVHWQWHYLMANLIAIVMVTLWNYGLNTTWTWTRLGASHMARIPAAPEA